MSDQASGGIASRLAVARWPLLLAVALVMAPGVAAQRPWSSVSDAGVAMTLYVEEVPTADGARSLLGLDPVTLAERASSPFPPVEAGQGGPLPSTIGTERASSPVQPVEAAFFSWLASADGSTVVAVSELAGTTGSAGSQNHPQQAAVYDSSTGRVRSQFDIPSGRMDHRLNQDGSRLVSLVPGGVPKWEVRATADGQLLSAVRGSGWADNRNWLLDPSGSRIFHLVAPNALMEPVRQPAVGPWAAELVTYDVKSGSEVGRLALPDVWAGTWELPDDVDGLPYPGVGELSPGIALSMDGTRLAIVHADAPVVTLVDTEYLVVERTVEISSEPGWMQRLLAFVLLAPQEASAKGPSEGGLRQAVFSPMGDSLYVWGMDLSLDGSGQPSQALLPLSAIDLETGRIRGEAEDGIWIANVVPDPGGRSVYAIGFPRQGESGQTTSDRMMVRRLDPVTLQSQAERRELGWCCTLLIAEAPTRAASGNEAR